VRWRQARGDAESAALPIVPLDGSGEAVAGDWQPPGSRTTIRLMSPELPTPAHLRATIDDLQDGLLERGAAVRLLLLAALAGEHVLLIGPPGTAKSELARRLHRAFAGARYFERLLTRFSTPEELFGPLSLKALEDDRYERLTEGYLPTASIAFLDEVFKANSAILNALLTLLNEREFDNGSQRLRTPLISVVGATNEVPTDEALMAFYDRFLVRVPVAAVSEAAFAALLALPPQASRLPAAAMRHAQLTEALAQRDAVQLPAEVVAHLHHLRGQAGALGIPVSDRRWRQLVGLLRCAALTEGRDTVDAFDLWLVPYVVAQHPEQLGALQAWFAATVAQAAPQEAPWLTRAVEAFEQQLGLEQQAQNEAADDGGAGKLALAKSLGGTAEGEMLRFVSVTLEAQLRKHYSPVHVAARLAQVDAVLASARGHALALHGELGALQQALHGRLWLPPELADGLISTKQHTVAMLDALVARLSAARAGYAGLPIDSALPEASPQPVAWSA
jgi:MoxR-like ATPase